MIDNKDIEKLSEVFATKEDLKELEEKFATKADLTAFKSEILDGQDEILKELKALGQEKTIADGQDKRKTKVLEIHNNALKTGKILSEKQVTEIDGLRVF